MTAPPLNSRGPRLWLAALIYLLTLLSPALAQDWTEADVILLGESHTSSVDHQGQLKALQAIRASNSKETVIAAEMFHEDGRTRLQEFADASAFQDFEPEFWKAQWGHPYELYRPIWQWAKQSGVLLTDLRPAPSRTETFKKQGVSATIPWLGEFYLGPAAYREHMARVAAEHMPTDVPISSEMIDRFYLTQCFWEEYMTWRILELKKARHEAVIVVLVGHGHLHPKFGLPARLRRRDNALSVVTVGFDQSWEWEPDIWYPVEPGRF